MEVSASRADMLSPSVTRPSIRSPAEVVNAQAFADQAVRLEQLGGREAVLAMPSFNHTPVGS